METNINKNTQTNTQPDYVKWGHYDDIKTILSGDVFTTVYLTGMSGNGKTSMISNICDEINKKCFRINIIGTTDEEDLIGGYELTDGNTVWKDRGVVEAMENGGVLLLDEIDLGTERLMCLQSILEGEGVFVKKQNKWIRPKSGFSIVATANTKGRGSDDGKFVYTNIMNEAFLDRFDFTFEQNYADLDTEYKILMTHMAKNSIPISTDTCDFSRNLCVWASLIRKTYEESRKLSDVISTRRLISIIKAYKKFNDRMKSINLALNRYDPSLRDAFVSYYTKIDSTINK